MLPDIKIEESQPTPYQSLNRQAYYVQTELGYFRVSKMYKRG
jgi:hypothetical protein